MSVLLIELAVLPVGANQSDEKDPPTMSPLHALAWFGLITITLVAIEIMYTYATQGFGFGFSSNRPVVELSPFGTRMKRTLQNHIESAGYIVPALAVAHLSGLQGSGIALAALLIVIGRAAYVVLYYSGIPFIRVPAFTLGTLSSLYLFLASFGVVG
ncbi:MAG: MAPEG family protein [Sphingomonadales bacterium]|nr:MAPEG family protein [Sphingomonadales bacterium]